jgi:predicted DNA-binding ribbon-helix-helix protein
MSRKRKTKKAETKHHTTLRLSRELWVEAEKVATLKRMSVTAVIETCLESGLPRLERIHREFLKDQE